MYIEEKIFKTGYSLKSGENYIELLMLEKGWFVFKHFGVKNTSNKKLYAELSKRFFSFAKKEKFTIYTREKDTEASKFLIKSGLTLNYSKLSFRKNLANHKSEYNDVFKYVSFEKAGLEKFYQIYKSSADSPIKNIPRYRKYIKRMKEEKLNENDLNNWKLVYLKNKPVGFVIPYRFVKEPELGTILNIGLLPEERGKGYGRIIHSKGLMILKEIGVKKYTGSTETDNYAMLKVFKINKCRKTYLTYFYSVK